MFFAMTETVMDLMSEVLKQRLQRNNWIKDNITNHTPGKNDNKEYLELRLHAQWPLFVCPTYRWRQTMESMP